METLFQVNNSIFGITMASPADDNSWQNEKSFEKTKWHMLKNELLCDVTFEVGTAKKENINAHKFILASRSPVFYAMFCGSLREGNDPIPIPDIEPWIFREILRFIYTEDYDISEESVMSLIYSSKKYECSRLTQKCMEYLNDQISVDNVCVILQHARIFDERELEDKCLKLVFENGESVLKSEGLLPVSREVLQKIIEPDELEAEEMSVYSACKRWAVHQCKVLGKEECSLTEARDQLGDLVYFIRFPAMSLEIFAGQVSSEEFLTQDEKVSIFQSISGVRTEKESFNKNSRLSAKRKRRVFKRFDQDKRNRGWTCDGEPDVINFKVSAQAKLVGICLYTPISKGRIEGQIKLQCETGTITSKDDFKIEYDPAKTFEEVLFERPGTVRVGKEYSVYAELSGPCTYYGENGNTSVTSGNLTVSFFDSKESTNCTSVESGQIHSLIFEI